MTSATEKAKSKKKVHAMHKLIVEECQRQKFTFREVDWLAFILGKSCGDSVDHYDNNDYDDLFYPLPIDESPKPMVTLMGAPDGGWVIVDVSFPEDPKQALSPQAVQIVP